jgi:flavorubredoxin
MAKVLIVYATRTGETEKIGNLIAEGIRFSGHEAQVTNVKEIQKEAALQGFDAFVFGSPTYHGEMMKSMKTLLFLAEKAGLDGNVGGAFGAFGWSGEAPPRIFDTMAHIYGMKMVGSPLTLKASWLDGGVIMAQDYGKAVTALL